MERRVIQLESRNSSVARIVPLGSLRMNGLLLQDLSPLDYSLWPILETEACSIPSPNIEALKAKLIKFWDDIPLDIVRAAVDVFPKRLRNVVKARGKHFE